MRGSARRPGAAGLVSWLIVAPSLALAQASPAPPVEAPRIEYRADAGCPTSAEFRGALAARLGPAASAGPSSLARAIEVELRSGGAGYDARLALVDVAGRSVERALAARTCAEAMDAIVVVAAVSLRTSSEAAPEPRSTLLPAARASAAPPPSSDQPNPAPASSLPAAPIGPEPSVPARAEPSDAERATRRPRGAPPSRARHRYSGALLAVPVLATGVGPGLVPGIGARVELTQQRERAASTVAATLTGYDSGRVDTAAGAARFDQITARLELTPWELRLGPHARSGPGAGLEVGRTGARAYADSVRVAVGRVAEEPWLALVFGWRLAWQPGRLAVAAGPELRLPLLPREFVVEPGHTAYKMPAIAPGIAVGAGAGF